MNSEDFGTKRLNHVSYTTPSDTYRPTPGYSTLHDTNYKVLEGYALRILEKKGYTKKMAVHPDFGTQKTYTVNVFTKLPDGGESVTFASKEDKDILVNFMVDIICERYGENRMMTFSRNIMSSEPDDVEKVAIECYEQWMKGINWPLKA